MRTLLPLCLVPLLLLGCDGDPLTIERTTARVGTPPGDTIPDDTIPDDTIPDDTVRLPVPDAAEAAAFLADIAARARAASELPEAQGALRLAGGFTAPNAVHPSVAPEDSCQIPFPPQFLRQEQLGVTYLWDADAGVYRYSDETGAPPCGFRLAVYTLDPASGEPVLPLERLGYVQMEDQGAMTTYSIRVTVVATPAGAPEDTLGRVSSSRYTDYYTRASSTSMSAGGFLEGAERLGFSRSGLSAYDGSPGASSSRFVDGWTYTIGSATVTWARNNSWYSFSSGYGATDSLTIRVVDGARSVEIAFDSVNGQLHGTLRAEGDWGETGDLANVRGTEEAPLFLDLNGDPLAAAVTAQLLEFWNAAYARFGVDGWPYVTNGGVHQPASSQ